MKETEKEVMLGVPEEDQNMISLQNHRAMVEMPEDAVEVILNAKVYHNGQLIDVSRKLTMDDIRTAFRKADDGYIDDEDQFVLTDKGRAWLDECESTR